MMKRTVILLLLLISALLFGCTTIEKSSTDTSTNSVLEKDIKYTIEQIYFSKSFQSIDPNVEVTESNGKKKISLNLGLSQYSEISIDDMKLEGDEFNIYISGHKDAATSCLSVPQMMLELKDSSIKDIKNLDFNIIYNDYDYIDIKFKINDVLNKLESQFKLALNSYPTFNLIKQDDRFVWEITYINIISRENEDYPLMNLHAKVDANTGEVLSYEKDTLSSVIDSGTILSFNDSGGLLYEKTMNNSDEKRNELWFYNSDTGEKYMIYNCHFSILSAKSTNDLSSIAFIEQTETSSEAYIYSNNDSKIYKLQFEREFNPQALEWKNDSLLYLLENKKDKSYIYSYDTQTNDIKLIADTNKDIASIVSGEDGFIVSEKTDSPSNNKISFTDDFTRYKTISDGFKPNFVNETTIAFLKNDENTDVNSLIVYDIKRDKTISRIGEDVINYRIRPEYNIVYLKNNPKYKDFTLSNYSLDLKTSKDLINVINKNVYYNYKDHLIYLNVELPFENENSNIIYSIKLNKEIKTP